MNQRSTVGQYLVDRLAELGLRHLFSIAGDYSIDWLNTYVEPSVIRVIQEVNELNAGFAADGYARLKGIGALCVTYSAGALSAVNAIAGAYVEKVPIVLINGTPSVKRTLTFEQTGFSAHHFISGRQTNLQVFEYITAAAVRIDNPALAPMLIDYALTQCITARRPVYIELLQDMVDLECEPPKDSVRPATLKSDADNLTQSIAAITDRLVAANNPLIWVGVEVDRFCLQAQVEKLIKQLNIPYVTGLMSKATLSENDVLFAGVFDGRSSSSRVQLLVEESDFILALGVWLTDINLLGWSPDFDNTAFASLDTVKYGTNFWPQVYLGPFIDRLLFTTAKRERKALPVSRASDHMAHTVNADDEITYQGLYDFVSKYIDDDTIVGADASMNYFGSIALKIGDKGGFIVQSSYSAIGYIAPAATGICLAKESSQRVIVFSGDGGFQTSAQCLSTQTRFDLNPIIFVINNGVYAVEQWLADPTVFHSGDKQFYPSCVLHSWNYSKLAEVFNCKGWRATTYRELEFAILGARENPDKPSIIEVVVDRKYIPDLANWKAQ